MSVVNQSLISYSVVTGGHVVVDAMVDLSRGMSVELPPGVEWGGKLKELGVECFEYGDDLPEEYRRLLLQLVRVQVDVETVLLFRDVLRDVIDLAPSPAHKMR